jgi:CBS domain containing-hemolysin-like protein
LVQSAFNFDELIVNSIFTPFHQVIFLKEDMSYEEVKMIHFKNFLTRYPVVDKRNEIIGIFNTKIFY